MRISAVYLIYLGVRVWRSPAPVVATEQQVGGFGKANPVSLFNQGLLVAISNPKGLIFFAAFLPQFVVPGVSYSVQLIVFGGTFVLVEFAYELLLAGLAQRIAPSLATRALVQPCCRWCFCGPRRGARDRKPGEVAESGVPEPTGLLCR
jgi:threonine/homoserine/homoserine lactone efflux protein